ncbi:MAG TPA: class I adenylate-forming enzyme family protein [Gammaproteobacteria bacterium]|nr:class I adenylate-forming enzyme family protein [Gammaproteobacteria bacterium]
MKTNLIDHLYFRAKAQPRAIAIQRLDGAISYGQLLSLVRGIAYKLRQEGVAPGQVVLTRLLDQQTEWLLTLAIMHEAAISCSAHGATPPPSNLDPDVIITGAPLSEAAAGRAKVIVIGGDWLNALPALSTVFKARFYDGEESVVRLMLTSGTTGQSQILGMSIRSLLLRCQNSTVLWNAGGRKLVMLPLSTLAGYVYAASESLRGGTFFCSKFAGVQALLDVFQIEYVFGSPMQLLGVSEQLGERLIRPDSLKMTIYMGGQVSPRLLDKIRLTMAPSVACLYGATEVGAVALYTLDLENSLSGEAGYVLPEARVEIVDERHQALGANREGVVRVRTPQMSSSYYADDEATQRHFRDGWFYPGDRGWLREDGMLVLAGREKELINRGGVKVDPALIDRQLLDYEEVQDAAAFGFENAMGMEDVAVAVVLNQEITVDSVRNGLVQALGLSYSPSAFVRVEAIPRNEMGKPLRAALRDEYAEKLRAYAGQT